MYVLQVSDESTASQPGTWQATVRTLAGLEPDARPRLLAEGGSSAGSSAAGLVGSPAGPVLACARVMACRGVES